MAFAFSRLRSMTFVRNVAVLASGTAMAQVVTVLAYPILLRLYQPEAFGALAVFGVVTMLSGMVGGWHYEGAAILVKTDEEAANLLALAIALVLGTTAAATAAVATFGEEVLHLFGAEHPDELMMWLPPAVLIFGLYSTQLCWATRHKRFPLLSAGMICRSAGVAGVQVAAGFAGLGAVGLMGGVLLGQTVALALLAGYTLRNHWGLFRETVSLRRMARLARAHRRFPLYSLPAGLLSSSIVTIPSLFLAAWFGPAVAGLYWFAYRLLEMPLTLLGGTTNRVLHRHLVEVHHDGKPILGLFLRATGWMALLAAGPALVLFAVAPPLFEIAFGAAWRPAGTYAQWIALWWFARFASFPSLAVIPILHLQRLLLIGESVAMVPRLLVIPLAARLASPAQAPEIAVAAFALVGAVFSAVCVLAVWLILRTREDAGGAIQAPPPAGRIEWGD